MLKHIVMWRLKDQAEGNTKAENAKLMKIKLENLKTDISEIKFVEVGINTNSSAQAFDVVLHIEFDNQDDLERYMKHPAHQQVSEFIGKIREERIVVDYSV